MSAVAADDGEQVVEVVGHAAGQAADGLHLLRLAELLLQLAALGDIDSDAAQVGGTAGTVGDGELVEQPVVDVVAMRAAFDDFDGRAQSQSLGDR